LSASPTSVAGRLPAWRLVAYAAPTLALQTMMVPLLLYLPPTYYSAEVGLGLGAVGLAFMLGRIFEAFSDPLIGALSDRTTSRFGPRRPWMAVGVPFAVVAAGFLVLPDPGASAGYLLGALLAFYLAWTMVFIPHQSWGGELSADYHERTRIAGFRETGAFLGYLLAAVVPLAYWTGLKGVAAPSFAQIVQSIGALFAVTLPLAVLACFAFVPAAKRGEAERPPSWGELYAILRRNRPFLRLASAYFIDRLAMGVYFAAQPLLISVAFGMMDHLLTIALVNTIAAACFAPLWIGVARRLGKHRTYVVANLVTMLSYALLFIVQPGDLWLVLVANAVMGCGNGGTMITPPAMAADTVDYDEMKSGFAQMGGHMAFLAFVFKAGMALGVAIGLPFIGLFGFDGAGGTPSQTALLGIRLCASWLPIVMLVPPILLMWQFPLDARRHGVIRKWLARRQKSPGALCAG
jgi:Na+/melibiose symporter-like transporter